MTERGHVLGTAVGAQLAVPSGILCASVPSGNWPGLVPAIVAAANHAQGVAGDAEPYAVRVVPNAHGAAGRHEVRACSVIKYRAGKRLFVWQEGEFDPDSSFSDVAREAFGPSFPATQTMVFALPTLAHGIVDVLRAKKKDLLPAGEWDALERTVGEVLEFLASAFEEAGSQAKSWVEGWWASAAMFCDELLTHILRAEPGNFQVVRDTYACAGLPAPAEGATRYRGLDKKRYAQAVTAHWSSVEAARESLGWLESQGLAEGLGELAWDELPARAIDTGHSIAALTTLGPSGPLRVSAWRAIDEKEFQRLLEAGAARGIIQVRVHDLPCPHPSRSDSVVVLPGREATWEVDGRVASVLFEDTALLLPWRGDAEAPAAPVTVQDLPPLLFRPKAGWAFDVSGTPEATPTGVVIRGRLSYRHKSRWPGKPVKLTLDTIPKGVLTGRLDPHAQCQLVLPCPWRVTTLVAWGNKPNVYVGGGGKFSASPEGFVGEESGDDRILQLKGSQKDAELVAYDGRLDGLGPIAIPTRVKVADRTSDESPDWSGASSLQPLLLHDGESFVAEDSGETLAEVSVEERTVMPWLPIEATAVGLQPRAGAPADDMCMDLRGRLEAMLGKALDQALAAGAEQARGLLQFVLVTRPRGPFRESPTDPGRLVHWPAEPAGPKAIENAGSGPSPDLLGSDEARALWDALLAILSALGFGGDEKPTWFCRYSLRDVDPDLVDAYLGAFEDLVDRGKELGPADHFWACYPFSAIVYDNDREKVSAVLLSPVHPIRLGWAYGAEQCVAPDDGAGPSDHRLLQVVEGWGFPWVGPAPASGSNETILAAVPSDPGPSQMFLAWSVLAHFDNLEGGAIGLPASAAGVALPGSSSSGLNEGGVVAAVRDFVRVYPHLPTLNIELYASSGSGRSAELDKAVLRELALITAQAERGVPLPRALIVHDSRHRGGRPPTRDAALEALGEELSGNGLRLEWRRYDPDSPPESDLRLVQDARVRVAREEDGEPRGVIARWPVRRFAPRERASGHQVLHSFPGNDGKGSWASFDAVLRAMEVS